MNKNIIKLIEDYFEENTFNDEEEFEDFSDTASP